MDWSPATALGTPSLFRRESTLLELLLTLVARVRDERFPTTIAEIHEIVCDLLAVLDNTAPSTRHEHIKHFNLFIKWCRDNDIRDIRDVGRDEAETFIHLPVVSGRGGREPSGPTRRNRRGALRRAYEVLRHAGYKLHDPTIDVTLPSPAVVGPRYCSDSQLTRLRQASLPDLFGTSHSPLLALAEAGATNGEISMLKASAVDLVSGRVTLCGNIRTSPRVNPLTEWGLEVLRTRLLSADPNDSVLVTAQGGFASPVVVSQYFQQLVNLSRVYGKRITIDSVRYWGALQVYERTKRIEDAAYFLGNASLNTVANGLGIDWRRNS